MQILELHLKNFGKFRDYHINFADHIQVFYGENEYGKSTIYAFIKAMLFGMERGRGRAAGRDEFSRYEPWENPNYYAGMMRFRCGGRTFRLERTFDRYTKSSSLICEDDGEELSVEAGDLEMLLGGMTAFSFENTAAIGQLTARPGQGLAAELKNYAANYYESGSSDVNLQGALEHLKARKKGVEQEQKAHREKRRNAAEKLEIQKQYVEMDETQLKAEMEETKQELLELKQKAKEQKKRISIDDGIARRADLGNGEAGQKKYSERKNAQISKKTEKRNKKRNVAALFCMVAGAIMELMAVGILGYGQLTKMADRMPILSGICCAAGAVFLLAGILLFMKNRRLYSRDQQKEMYGESAEDSECNNSVEGKDDEVEGTAETESDEDGENATYEIQKLEWELARIREELKEKNLLKSNLQEQLLETEDISAAERNLREKLRALELAELRIKEAAKETARSFGERLNREASQILHEITDGKYSRLLIGEDLDMAVLSCRAYDTTDLGSALSEGKRIPAERLSRGTLEQIYFSLRMAALDILYEEEIPVVLDDAFVFYDEKRLKSALKWLSEQSRQVIIFSCQTREKQLVSSMGKWKDEIR